MESGTRLRLGLMMFLEYAIWGAWSPILGAYLINNLKFTGDQVGMIYMLLPLACIFSPMFFGQLADRFISTERLLAGLHLVGAVILWKLASVTDYGTFLFLMLAWSVVFAPTLVLTNSISFDHMSNSEKEFGLVRAGGSLGWIAAGLLLALWLYQVTGSTQVAGLEVAALFSLALGIFDFFLPHTPPKREGTDPLAFMKALRMLENRNFTIFLIISFVVATELMFYYILTAPFLEHLGVGPKNTPWVLIIAQVAEVGVMGAMLPAVLPKWGVRKTMVIGILAWPVRYLIFAAAAYYGPSALAMYIVAASLTLHGFCYVFFFAVGFVYVDQVAPPDIRASAQSLIGVVSLGIGMALGSLMAGRIQAFFTQHPTSGGAGVTNWTGVFLVPCVLTILCAIIFPMLFKDPDRADEATIDAGATDLSATQLKTAPTLEVGPQ